MSGARPATTKERLTFSEFLELIPHLSLTDLVRVEYRIETEWISLVNVVDAQKSVTRCNLCGVNQSGMKNLGSHLDGKRHRLQLERVEQLFHSNYTYGKYQKKFGCRSVTKEAKPQRGPNTSNTNAPTSLPKKAVTVGNGKATQPAKNATNSALQKPKVVRQTLPPSNPEEKKQTNQAGSSDSVKTIEKQTTSANNIKSNNCIEKSNTSPQTKIPIAIPKSTALAKRAPSVGKSPMQSQKTTSSPINSKIPIQATKKTAVVNKTDQPKSTVSQPQQNIEQPTINETEVEIVSTQVISVDAESTAIISTEKSDADNTALNSNTTPAESKISDESLSVPSEAESKISDESLAAPPTKKGSTSSVKNLSLAVKKSVELLKDPSDDITSPSKNVEITEMLVLNPYALNANSKTNIPPAIVKPASTEKLTATAENQPVVEDVIVITDEGESRSNNKRPRVADIIEIDPTNEEPKIKKLRVLTPAKINARTPLLENPDTAPLAEEVILPRYQSNIVIIPTKHKQQTASSTSLKDPQQQQKSKSESQTQLQQPQSEQPGFTVKTFSSKPSENDIQGLIGVEYVIKILKYQKDPCPRYECGLCELILSGVDMQNHLVSYSHRLKYCEKHFPNAMRQYKQYVGNLPHHDVYKVMAPILDKLAVAIEQHHGRYLPFDCILSEYTKGRHDILAKVFSLRHACEQFGPTFTHVVDAKEVDKLIEERHTYQYKPPTQPLFFDKAVESKSRWNPVVSTDTRNHYSQRQPTSRYNESQMHSNQYTHYQAIHTPQHPQQCHYIYENDVASNVLDTETHKQMVEQFLRKTGKSTEQSSTRYSHKRARLSDHDSSLQSRSRTFSISPTKSISPLRENDIWQAYRHRVDQKLTELKQVFKSYRKDPECHPMYNEEWQKFWKRRKNELVDTGIDHRTYNYQPEWVRFFKVRLEELYSEGIENIKIQSRSRLCLPMTNDELEDTFYHVQVEESPVAGQHSLSHNVEVPTEVSPMETYKEANTYRKPATQKVLENNQRMGSPKEKESVQVEPKVVDVLRLMTALEDHLGSLGPRIVDLMGKALQIEKRNPENVISIILTEENCTLLETALEKFKGLILTGLSEGSRERALKRAITDIDRLLKYTEKEREKNAIAQGKNVDSPAITDRKFGSISAAVASSGSRQNVASNTRNVQSVDKTISLASKHLDRTKAISNMLAKTDNSELAIKIAKALASQGKTDLDPDHFQQLLAVYSVMEKKKREVAKLTMSQQNLTAAFNPQRTSLSDSLTVLQRSQASREGSNPSEISGTSYTSQASNNTAATGNLPNRSNIRQTTFNTSGGSSGVGNGNSLNTPVPYHTKIVNQNSNFQAQRYLQYQTNMNDSSNNFQNRNYMSGGGSGQQFSSNQGFDQQRSSLQIAMNPNGYDNNYNQNTANSWDESTNYPRMNSSNEDERFWR